MDFNFTREEYEELAQAAPHFETAVKQNAKHNSPKWLDETVKRIYERVAGPQMVNYNCPSCVFQLYQKCGRLWLQDKIKYAALEAEKKKQEESQTSIEPVQEPEAIEVDKVAVETKEEPEENNIVIKEVDDETWNKLNQFIEEHKDDNIEAIKQPKKRGRKPKNSK